MLIVRIVAAALLCVVFLCGCGGPGGHTVSGTVTLDGEPVPDGDIMFVDPDKKLGPDATKVKAGKFSLLVKPGKKKVEIRASRMEKLPPGKKGAMGETEMPVDYIPARYNTKTELDADIGPGGKTSYDFQLKSK